MKRIFLLISLFTATLFASNGGPIGGGGTSLPDQSGHTGEALFTSGSTLFWQAAAGSGTVSNITSSDSSLDISNPTTTPNITVHFPMVSTTGGSAASPAYAFGNSGIYASGFGSLELATAGVKALGFDNAQQATFTNTVSATDFIYPTKSANTFLAGPTTGSPAIPNFRSIQPGDISSDDIPFPLESGGSVSSPAFSTGGGGMYGVGYGVVGFSTLGVERLRIENNGGVEIGHGGSGSLTVNGDGVFTGNISAANYPPPPPTGSALHFAGYDNTGALFTIPGWAFQDGSGALGASVTRDITADGGFTAYNFEMGAEATADNLIGVTGANYDLHFDRNNTGASINSLYGLSSSVRSEGTGYVQELRGLSIGAQAGGGSGGGLGGLNLAQFNGVISSGTTMTSNAGVNGLGVFINANSSTADNGYLINSNIDQAVFTNNFNGIISSVTNSTFNNAYSMFNGYSNNSNTFNGNNWYGVIIGNDAPINGFSSGFHATLNGNVVKNYEGVGISSNANTLTSPGFNLSGFDLNVNNTTFNGDNFNGFNGFVAGVGNTLANVNAFIFNNQLSGTNRFSGISLFNNQNQIEEIRMANLNSSGNARTQTGVDIYMSGVATDDARGLRINTDNLSSSTQRVHAIEASGGTSQIFGNFTPMNSLGVDVGNNITALSKINSGSPLTGTDQIVQLFQSNLQADDDIATGPFGLDTNMIGMASQVVVGSGKTIPVLRSLLLGTSVPSGSGGTVTDHVVLEILGLPSFGGVVTNANRIGIEDSQLLGQSFCGGANPATNCWFLRVRDSSAQVSSASGFQMTTSGSQPTCDVAHRGTLWNIEGGTGVADQLQICQKDAADAYNWVNIP